jgi:hypothetical protein
MEIKKELDKMPVDPIPKVVVGRQKADQTRAELLEAYGGRIFGRQSDERWAHVQFMRGATAPRGMHAVSYRSGGTKQQFCPHFCSS